MMYSWYLEWCVATRMHPVIAGLRSENAASLAGLTPPKTDENGDIIQPALQPKKLQPAPNSKAKAKQRLKSQQQQQVGRCMRGAL